MGFGFTSHGAALAAIVLACGCSSGSGSGSNVVPQSGSSGGSTSSGGSPSSSSAGGSSSGGSSSSSGSSSSGGSSSSSGSSSSGGSDVPDGGCPPEDSSVLGLHIQFTVTWPSTSATDTGTGPVDIWLLSDEMNTGTGDLMSMGTTHTCGTNVPDLPLNMTGAAAACAPGHTCGNTVQVQLLPSTFDAIKRTFAISGMQTSWNPGGTITAEPTTTLLGLAQTSSYQTASTAWPPYCASSCTPSGAFSMSDVTDDDNDGNPGITANPKSDACAGSGPCKYTLPPTALTLFQVPPLADQVYIVSRSAIAISAKRMSDCTHGSGTATVTAFDNHVVGCHIQGGSTCSSDQVSFLDQNRTIYGVDANNVASPSHPIKGTVTLVQLPAGSTCADARKIH